MSSLSMLGAGGLGGAGGVAAGALTLQAPHAPTTIAVASPKNFRMVSIMPKTNTERRRHELATLADRVAWRAMTAALDVIEAETPCDVELRQECASGCAKLLASGILARMQDTHD